MQMVLFIQNFKFTTKTIMKQSETIQTIMKQFETI